MRLHPNRSRLILTRNSYLLVYDALSFHAYLETLIASNSSTAPGITRQNQSPWLFTDAAHVIFQAAKRRCYVTIPTAKSKALEPVPPEDDIFNDPGWDVFNEVERQEAQAANVAVLSQTKASKKPNKKKRKAWLPDDMDPILEELPKWSLLAEVLQEIEEETVTLEATLSSSEF